MTTDNPNRYRISTKFTIVKIFVVLGLFAISFNLIKLSRATTFTQKSIVGLTLSILALTSILYFVSTRKKVDYDNIKQTLYVTNKKSLAEIEIPVEKIDQILYSALGGQGNKSYVIIYRDFQNQRQRFRLFPIPGDNSIDTIITDTKFKNPDLVTRKFSIGWNEFFD